MKEWINIKPLVQHHTDDLLVRRSSIVGFCSTLTTPIEYVVTLLGFEGTVFVSREEWFRLRELLEVGK